jgi:Tfp pilus assembly protein PilE
MKSTRQQRGVTLVVSLIMLVLITLVVVHGFNMSFSNLKSVRNVQTREEALAAAHKAVEQFVSGNFTTVYGTATVAPVQVDVNNDGTADYTVVIATPQCVRAVVTETAKPSDVELGTALSSGAFWNTDWDVSARVTDAATGTDVQIREGFRVRLGQTDKDQRCP